jgi:hypothetical protein
MLRDRTLKQQLQKRISPTCRQSQVTTQSPSHEMIMYITKIFRIQKLENADDCSILVLLSVILCYSQTDPIIVVTIVDLLRKHDLPHLTRIASLPEIRKYDNPVNKEYEADAK